MLSKDIHNNLYDHAEGPTVTGGFDYGFKGIGPVFLEDLCIVSTFDDKKLEELKEGTNYIKVIQNINDCRFINKSFETVNSKLPLGGIFIGKFEEYSFRKIRILPKTKPLNYAVHIGDIIFHRVIPKLNITKDLYFEITKGKGRVLSKAEAFGRLYSCGFEIINEIEIKGELHFTARKIKSPNPEKCSNYGPLIKLKRMGKYGKFIKVYKLRTMHPFSEYLQDYVYQKNELQEGGKFKNDFRISREGHILRKFWIDELPMIINLLRGEMKIVGVRPLSAQYFNLYPKELQEKRILTKPGLLPPFYADMPKTLGEIIESEMKYLQAYEKSPLETDWKYFKIILRNIFLRGARSK